MYWLNGIANELSLNCTINNIQDEKTNSFPQSSNIVCIRPSYYTSLYITCTRNAIYLWSVKPNVVLSFVERSEKHVEEFGENVEIIWKPDASALAIQTSKNYLLLYAINSYEQHSFEFNFPNSSTHAIVSGPGEGKGPRTMLIKFKVAIRIDAGIACETCSDDMLIIVTKSPIALQRVSWNPHQINTTRTTILNDLVSEIISYIVYDKTMNMFICLSNEGRVYALQNSNLAEEQNTESKIDWQDICFHSTVDKATAIDINPKFSFIAVGTHKGIVYIYSTDTKPVLSHKLELPLWSSKIPEDENSIESIEWTSDGYAIAVGYKKHGLAVYSVYGSLLCSSSEMDDNLNNERLKDTYVKGIRRLFWGPGNYQLFVLSEEKSAKLFSIPFVKSALTSYLHSDNIRRGLLQTDDRILLYNNWGDYQENNTTIDPAAVAWTHIQYPNLYITDHWPIRYTSISTDGKYIAIAGKRGFAHYNAVSNRWKLFGNQQQEQSFLVRGGMVWYKDILIVACESIQQKGYQIRMYSRDSNLDNTFILHTEPLLNVPVYVTLCGNYLLVYTSENVINIYNVNVNALSTNKGEWARLDLVRRISLMGIVSHVLKVRSINLFSPIQGEYINTNESMISANIILLVKDKLILLRPKTADEETTTSPFHMYIIHEKTEYYWIGKKSIENMITSLWITDGKGLKVFTNVLLGPDFDFNTYNNDIPESEPTTPITPCFMKNEIGKPFSLGSESMINMNSCRKWNTNNFNQAIYIPLDFYPISILLDKGIIIGIEQNISYKDSLGLILFKMSPKMHLFLHHILRYLLQQGLEEDAVIFAKVYERFVYFSHALEILLHTVLEEEAGQDLGEDAILPLVIKFLDQFPHALDVIVSCARKTEVALWDHLFSVVGKPKDLFEFCLSEGRLRTATSYLIILQTLQPLEVGGKDTVRLLEKAMDEHDYELCKELVRFLSSIDSTGKTLQETLITIKSRMDDPLSPSSQEAQIDKVVESMSNLDTV
ncbi:RIC1-domain-containing protein [Cokeromyces recurvatus]|uniref:RIC1-domain-containing protein n=1 Tax=Cokeromyces recurvatus TaxID=90255 RepID=UPI00222086DF|nr:RIC1-domain-containing protein [Cokeromyces recurvatus]KAI7899477.1 RIC1-domain-containing protein [Cokeromyces recurvatus]